MTNDLSTQSDTKLFREALEMEVAELHGTLKKRTGATIESVAEECERIVLASQRELTIEMVDRASLRLREVESALRRIREGCFGDCIDCEEQIPRRRLAAIPWASRCVRCQEATDVQSRPYLPVRDEAGLTRAG